MPSPISALTKIKNMYSPLERAVIAHKLESMPSSQWAAYIKANAPKGAKKEALAVRLDELLAKQPKLTKAEIVKYIQEKSPKINTKNLRADGYGSDETQYGKYVLPGGEDYTETLIHLPANTSSPKIRMDKAFEITDANGTVLASGTMPIPMRTLEKINNNPDWVVREFDQPNLSDVLRDPSNFRSGHFDEPNVLAHLRTNIKLTPDNKDVLFLEELQSDWAQQGRKRGFRPNTIEEYYNQKASNVGATPWEELDDNSKAMIRNMYENEKGIPRGPYVEDTGDWTALGLKKAIERAVDEGQSHLAWTTGTQQANRYNLATQIDSINHRMNPDGTYGFSAIKNGQTVISRDGLTQDQLADQLGKDIAEKIVKTEGAEAPVGTSVGWEAEPSIYGDVAAPPQPRTLSGLDLQVGGEGMRTYYDQIIPSTANDILKSMGVTERVKPIGVQLGNNVSEQMGFDITPEIRDYVINQGLPAFAGGGIVRSGIKDLMDLVAKYNGRYGAQRVERAADEVPNLEQQYTKNALKNAFTGKGDTAQALTIMRPSEFEEWAQPLSKSFSSNKNYSPDLESFMSHDEYIDYLAKIATDSGFSDVPYLQMRKDEVGIPLKPYMTGHEGRHRTRALNKLGDQATLIEVLPYGDLRSGLPRQSQEEYIEALKKELEMQPLVRPEPIYRSLHEGDPRDAKIFPKVFKEGGPVHMDEGGKVSDPFANLSMLDKAKLLAKAAKYRIQYNEQATEHGKYPDALSSALKKKYLDDLGNSRVNRSPLDVAINYGGGYDFGVRQDIPADVARDMGKAYQYTDYFFSPFTGPKSDAVGDYYENMAGVEAGIKERGRRATEDEIQRRSADYGKRSSKMLPQYEEENFADGGAVETDGTDYDEMYEFKDYGNRETGEAKDTGALGEIRMPNGRDVMTEYSINVDGREMPSIVEGMHPADINYIRETGTVPEDAVATAIRSANKREAMGESPFWNKKETPAFADGGEVDYDAMYEFKQTVPGFAKGGPVLSVGRGEKLPVSKGAGLTAKGRAKYNAATGSNLKAPAPNPKTKADAGRRKSFCARMSGMPGPMKDEQGNPTRKAASLKRWNCN